MASDFILNHLDSGMEIREDKWRAEYDQDIKYILYTYEIIKKKQNNFNAGFSESWFHFGIGVIKMGRDDQSLNEMQTKQYGKI